jgi:hypothetical protein
LTRWESRGKIELLWQSEIFLMKIYFDPQGGINCLFAKRYSQHAEVTSLQWRYMNELLLESYESYEREITRSKEISKRRGLDEQLDHIVMSLNEKFPIIKKGLERPSWTDRS